MDILFESVDKYTNEIGVIELDGDNIYVSAYTKDRELIYKTDEQITEVSELLTFLREIKQDSALHYELNNVIPSLITELYKSDLLTDKDILNI